MERGFVDVWTLGAAAVMSVSWLALYWLGRSGEWLARQVFVRGRIVLATESVRLLSGVRGLRRSLRSGSPVRRLENVGTRRARVARVAGWVDEQVTEAEWQRKGLPLALIVDEKRAREDLRAAASHRLGILESDQAVLLCFSEDRGEVIKGLLKLLFSVSIGEKEVLAVGLHVRRSGDPEAKEVLDFHGERFREMAGAGWASNKLGAIGSTVATEAAEGEAD